MAQKVKVDFNNPDTYLIEQQGYVVIDYNKFKEIALKNVPVTDAILPLKIVARHKELSKKVARGKNVQVSSDAQSQQRLSMLEKSYETNHIDSISFPCPYYNALSQQSKHVSYMFNAGKYVPLMQRRVYKENGKRLPLYTIDCFADSHNAQCVKFVTKKEDWNSMSLDYLHFWELEIGFMNPPFYADLIMRSVTTARRRKMRTYLVMPYAKSWKKTVSWCGKYCDCFVIVPPSNDLFKGAMDDYVNYLPSMKWGVILFYFDFGFRGV